MIVKRRTVVVILAAVLVLATRHALLSLTVSVLQAPLRLGHQVARLLRDLADFPRLRGDNVRLSATVAQLSEQMLTLQETAREHERLRALLDVQPLPQSRWIPARLVGLSPAPGTRAVVLDQGAQAGVRTETSVVTADGLVGKVVTVRARTSLALLLTDPNFRAGCLVERSRETGVLAGSLDGRVWIQLLPANADVAVGDTVITSGLGGVFPKGLRIGTVRRVGVDSGGLYRLVEVMPAVKMSRLEDVLCQGPP